MCTRFVYHGLTCTVKIGPVYAMIYSLFIVFFFFFYFFKKSVLLLSYVITQ